MKKNGTQSTENRERVIVRTSAIGILANIILASFKAFVGIISNSIAVTLDAVNNLSDAVSSVITIIGAKVSGKSPDKKHPFGHGRVEYLSQMIIAAIVLYAGITSLTESFKKIINPEVANYTTSSLVIIGAAIVVKLFLGTYVQRKGKEVKSGSLIASGKDAMFDSILSISVLASAIIYIKFHLSLEAYVGVVISLFIMKSGLEMIRDAIDEIIGIRVSGDLSKSIKDAIAEEPAVHGVYDLFMNNYGPDRYIASAHVEVDDTMTASEIDAMTRRIQEKIYREYAVTMGAIGIYSVNTNDDAVSNLYENIRRISMSEEGALELHGFFADVQKKRISFDLVVDFDIEDRTALVEKIKQMVQAEYPDYEIFVTLDGDVSD